MRILIEHVKLRTIPHDLMEFFSVSNVPFYEGCMIVQVYDHKSAAPLQDSSRAKSGPGKTVPFSVHNYNQHLTPSPYVPFPLESLQTGGSNTESDKSKDSGQKNKENMPAPAAPADVEQSKSEALAKRPKVSTIVLYPTSVSNHADITIKAADARSNSTDGRIESRQEMNGPLSATVPPTPSTAVPSTPQASMAPPAKRQKKLKVELDSSNIHAIEAQITLATTAPLLLDAVSSAMESAALLESLSHPMHSEKPPSPKTRKRTVAEMAADEALAVAQERYMLCFDERLSASTAGAQGGANQADGDGQAGGASFEPRFERFKTLENIKIQLEENKKAEKARQVEVERKSQQDRERERLRLESEKREAEKTRQQAMQQEAARRQQEAAHRRVMSASQQPQPTLQGVPPQIQGQHGHPQPNNIMANGIPGQPQRFHQQQATQAQLSSPIVRNGTPQSHMSPANNMGNIPMQHSTSSIGGSPPRPGSAVHINHPQIGGPASNNMTAQRSQQSHAGTPRMPNATPNLQSTPLSRQVSQTPRMSQASPIPGPMGQAPHMQQVMGPNGQPINLNPAQQQQFQQQQQQALFQQRMRQQAASQGMASMNGQPMTQQQMVMLRAQQAQQSGQMTSQMAQNYSAQMAAMQRAVQAGAMPPNMNFPNNPAAMQNMQQMQQQMQLQQLQQMQFQQQQAQAQAQAQAQQHPQQVSPQAQQQLMMRKAISGRAHQIYQQQIPQFQAQYPGGIPEEVLLNLRRQCNQTATVQITQQMNAQRMQQQQQQQMMAAAQQQHGGMQQNGMQNGMGMQRPQ